MFPGFDDPQVRYKELGRRVILDWLKDRDSIRDDEGELLLMFRAWCYAADYNPEKLAEKLERMNDE